MATEDKLFDFSIDPNTGSSMSGGSGGRGKDDNTAAGAAIGALAGNFIGGPAGSAIGGALGGLTGNPGTINPFYDAAFPSADDQFSFHDFGGIPVSFANPNYSLWNPVDAADVSLTAGYSPRFGKNSQYYIPNLYGNAEALGETSEDRFDNLGGLLYKTIGEDDSFSNEDLQKMLDEEYARAVYGENADEESLRKGIAEAQSIRNARRREEEGLLGLGGLVGDLQDLWDQGWQDAGGVVDSAWDDVVGSIALGLGGTEARNAVQNLADGESAGNIMNGLAQIGLAVNPFTAVPLGVASVAADMNDYLNDNYDELGIKKSKEQRDLERGFDLLDAGLSVIPGLKVLSKGGLIGVGEKGLQQAIAKGQKDAFTKGSRYGAETAKAGAKKAEKAALGKHAKKEATEEAAQDQGLLLNDVVDEAYNKMGPLDVAKELPLAPLRYRQASQAAKTSADTMAARALRGKNPENLPKFTVPAHATVPGMIKGGVSGALDNVLAAAATSKQPSKLAQLVVPALARTAATASVAGSQYGDEGFLRGYYGNRDISTAEKVATTAGLLGLGGKRNPMLKKAWARSGSPLTMGAATARMPVSMVNGTGEENLDEVYNGTVSQQKWNEIASAINNLIVGNKSGKKIGYNEKLEPERLSDIISSAINGSGSKNPYDSYTKEDWDNFHKQIGFDDLVKQQESQKKESKNKQANNKQG